MLELCGTKIRKRTAQDTDDHFIKSSICSLDLSGFHVTTALLCNTLCLPLLLTRGWPWLIITMA